MKHFKLSEFDCKCCGENKMDDMFLQNLDNARYIAGIPFVITSGYRCEKHNKKVGSTSANHTSGLAADIQCYNGPARLKIVSALINAGFTRIGISTRFVHVDEMIGKVESIWVY